MRPVPKSSHFLAVVIFAAVAAMAAHFAIIDTRLSKEQINISTVALKRHAPDQYFAHDPVFGESGRWRFHTPLLQALMEMSLVPTGYKYPHLPFRILAGILTMVYLLGMYSLLHRQCRSWSVSAFVAVLSSTVTYTLGRAHWGLGPLGTITPPTMILAITPLIVHAFLRYENQWRVVLIFAFIGLAGNLHLVSAVNLTMVLLIVYLGRRRFAPSAWPVAASCAAAFALTAAPYAFYYLALRFAEVPADAEVSAAAVFKAFRLGRLAILYPEMLKSLLYWLLAVLVLLIPAAGVLTRIERFKVRDLSVWVWFASGACFISLVLHGASQLVGVLAHRAPPVIDFAQASTLVMLSLYVLFAHALTTLFRLIRTHRHALRWVLAAFIAAWMLPSDNLKMTRHLTYDWATSFIPEAQRPQRIQELISRQEKRDEFAEIALWARDNSDQRAVFLTDRAEFRLLARRALVATDDDVKYYYYVTPWRIDEWISRVERQRAVLRPPAGKIDDKAVVQFVEQLKTEGFEKVTDWYAIVSAANAPMIPGGALEPVPTGKWGQYYALYRIRQ